VRAVPIGKSAVLPFRQERSLQGNAPTGIVQLVSSLTKGLTGVYCAFHKADQSLQSCFWGVSFSSVRPLEGSALVSGEVK
jgi:hypothetical protein